MFSLSQCCTKWNSHVFCFWASRKGQLPNCLVMETTCRHHSIQCLKNILPPRVNKTEQLYIHFFPSLSIKHLYSINLCFFLGVIYSYGIDLVYLQLVAGTTQLLHFGISSEVQEEVKKQTKYTCKYQFCDWSQGIKGDWTTHVWRNFGELYFWQVRLTYCAYRMCLLNPRTYESLLLSGSWHKAGEE